MKPPCSIEGCGKPFLAHGLCSAHYTRQRRHGSPTGGGTPLGQPIAWLEANASIVSNECLPWPFGRCDDGYGRLHFLGKNMTASRAMCIMVHGLPPTPQHEAAHSCGKGHEGCTNPRHIRWKTRSENQIERADHGTDMRGEKHFAAKLTENDVREIRNLRGILSQREIGRRFGINQARVSDIQLHKEWKYVKQENGQNG